VKTPGASSFLAVGGGAGFFRLLPLSFKRAANEGTNDHALRLPAKVRELTKRGNVLVAEAYAVALMLVALRDARATPLLHMMIIARGIK